MLKVDAEHLRSTLDLQAAPFLDAALLRAEHLARDWDLEIEDALPGATRSLVLAAGEFVLRLPLLDQELGVARTLREFAAHGGIPVLREDAASGAILLPRLRPGTTLAETPQEEAIEAWADLVRRLRDAEGAGLNLAEYVRPTLAERPLPHTLRRGLPAEAARLARLLLDTSPPPRLLHGDLHHFNVLRAGDGWVAVDPVGIEGDPSFECAAFLCGPVPELTDAPDLPGCLRHRILRLASRIGDPPERLWGWTVVQTVQCVSLNEASSFRDSWVMVLDALDGLRHEFSV